MQVSLIRCYKVIDVETVTLSDVTCSRATCSGRAQTIIASISNARTERSLPPIGEMNAIVKRYATSYV